MRGFGIGYCGAVGVLIILLYAYTLIGRVWGVATAVRVTTRGVQTSAHLYPSEDSSPLPAPPEHAPSRSPVNAPGSRPAHASPRQINVQPKACVAFPSLPSPLSRPCSSSRFPSLCCVWASVLAHRCGVHWRVMCLACACMCVCVCLRRDGLRGPAGASPHPLEHWLASNSALTVNTRGWSDAQLMQAANVGIDTPLSVALPVHDYVRTVNAISHSHYSHRGQPTH